MINRFGIARGSTAKQYNCDHCQTSRSGSEPPSIRRPCPQRAGRTYRASNCRMQPARNGGYRRSQPTCLAQTRWRKSFSALLIGSRQVFVCTSSTFNRDAPIHFNLPSVCCQALRKRIHSYLWVWRFPGRRASLVPRRISFGMPRPLPRDDLESCPRPPGLLSELGPLPVARITAPLSDNLRTATRRALVGHQVTKGPVIDGQALQALRRGPSPWGQAKLRPLVCDGPL
jgi:hypothetical protein